MAIINGLEFQHYPLLGNTAKEYTHLDLSVSGEIYNNQDIDWREELHHRTSSKTSIPYGGYLENRFFYSNENLFGSGESKRDIHLGVDLWVMAGTKIFCPLNATVHSMANNSNDLDYGYTIILCHQIDQFVFYTLYGHLNDSHLSSLKVNEPIPIGTPFCQVGDESQNGNWPPHLHFQVIVDIGAYSGDYPGVCNKMNLEFFSKNCPDGSTFI